VPIKLAGTISGTQLWTYLVMVSLLRFI